MEKVFYLDSFNPHKMPAAAININFPDSFSYKIIYALKLTFVLALNLTLQ